MDRQDVYEKIDITKDRPKNGFSKIAKWGLFIIAIILGISIVVALLLMLFQ